MNDKDLIIKCNRMFTAKEINEVRESILKQMKDGVVVLPPGFELAQVDEHLLKTIIGEVSGIKFNKPIVNNKNRIVSMRDKAPIELIQEVIEIIDKHISELKGENK